jgi:pentatricopeptide repeat protein
LLALCDGLEEASLHIGTPKEPAPADSSSPTTKSIVENDETNATKRSPDSQDGETGTDGAEKASAASPADMSLADRKRHAFRIKTAMDEHQIPLTEAAYTAVIKLLARTENLVEAEKLLLESEAVQQCKPKLRLYSSLLQAYAEQGKLMDAVKIWDRLTRQKLLPLEKEYLVLLRCAVACQCPTLMESVLTDLAEDVPVPCRDTTQAIVDWFTTTATAANRPATTTDTKIDQGELQQLLERIHTPSETAMRSVSASMGPVVSSLGWTVSRLCSLATETGRLTSGCLEGELLHPIEIAPETWEDMRKANETIVLSGQLDNHRSAFQGGKKGKKRVPTGDINRERERRWQAFRKYLDERKTPIDVVIDGANIGYFEQNFTGANTHVSYEQIEWVIQACRAQGQSVLLVMHSRHFHPRMVPREFESLVRRWREEKVLYQTPPGMNDDWFWMHVALARPGTLMLTNDEMRDHHFQMLAPRSFLRWKERHQVHFSLGEWLPGKHRRKVIFTNPDPYSRRVQRVADGLVVPLPKRGDDKRFMDGVFAADDEDTPVEETYLCLRPKQA